MKLLLEAWRGAVNEEKRREEKRKTPDSHTVSTRQGSASGGEGCETDGTFNRLHRRGTNVGQSPEELMQNKRGLLFRTEGPPLDQIIGQAVDISLPSIVSTEGAHTISHSHPDVFHLARPSFLLMNLLPDCGCPPPAPPALFSLNSDHLYSQDQHNTISETQQRWRHTAESFLWMGLTLKHSEELGKKSRYLFFACWSPDETRSSCCVCLFTPHDGRRETAQRFIAEDVYINDVGGPLCNADERSTSFYLSLR